MKTDACSFAVWPAHGGRAFALGCIGLSGLAAGCHHVVDDADASRPVVAIARVMRSDLASEVVFPAEFRPWFAVELHAQVAGFVHTLAVDIGDEVKAGQVLAELEIPLLNEDIARAQAVLRRSEAETLSAQATAEDAHLAFTRLGTVARAQPNLIAQQDLDAATEKDHRGGATLAAAQQQVRVAQAELDRLRREETDTRIVAPFDGVVTQLDASPGDLVLGGLAPSGQARALLRLAQLDKLRLSFPVSAGIVAQIRTGDPVTVRLDDGRTISARIARFSHEVTWSTRTMEVEADVPNLDRSLVPGMYAAAVLHPENREKTLVIPVEAVLRKAGACSVFVVNAGGLVEERLVRLGLETPARVEILSGVREGDRVVIGGLDRVQPGQKVETRMAAVLNRN